MIFKKNVTLRAGVTFTGALIAFSALLSGLFHPAPAVAKDTQKTIVLANFDSTKVGNVDPVSFNKAVGPTNKNTSAYLGMTYRHDYRGSGNVVRTKLAANKYILSSGEGRGNVLMIKLPGSYDSACMSYDVRFESGFDFSAGGKLPGLVGVAPGTSPSTPEGGGSTAHGWSGRLMWVGAKEFSFVRNSGRSNMLVTYLYHPGQAGTYGDDIYWGNSFVAGVWYHVRQCHWLNTVGKANGVLQTWFDGVQTMYKDDVVYRTDPAVHITNFDWSVFRGGNTSAWASPKTGYVDIDNLRITAG